MTLFIQITTAILVGAFYYMVAVVMTVYDGFLSFVFQPLMGIAFSVVAILVLLVLGLPLRMSKRLNSWWRRYWCAPFVVGSIAFGLMLASWIPRFRVTVFDPELQAEVSSFHPALAISGWLLTIFAVLHFYPPFFGKKFRNEK
jgi:uncharacterized membrane protein YqgA involved in biofilm formation